MKKLFIMLAAAATVASCANEETVMEAPGQAIEFGNVFVDNATRANAVTDPSYSTSGKGVALESFNVYGAVGGVNIFNGDKVVKGTAAYGNAWALEDPNQKTYWIAGADYKFVGVVDGNKTGVTAITPDDAGLPKTIAYTVDGRTDLLCDVVTCDDVAAPYPLVAFNFTHLLSKVKFSVKNTSTDATNYRFVLTSAKLTNVYEDGVYDVNADSWTPGSNMREFELDETTITNGATQYHNHEILLIPGSKKVGVVVAANIEATDDGGTTWETVSTISKTFENVVELEKSKAYNFIVELGVGTEIQFTANQMPEWGNGNTVDTDEDDVNDSITL